MTQDPLFEINLASLLSHLKSLWGGTPGVTLSHSFVTLLLFIHWETKGQFRKRVVLANVPSFRFSFRGNIRTYPRSGFRSRGRFECTLVPVFVPGGTSAKTTLFKFWKTTLLATPIHVLAQHLTHLEFQRLRWAKSRESYRRIASENYRSDSNH